MAMHLKALWENRNGFNPQQAWQDSVEHLDVERLHWLMETQGVDPDTPITLPELGETPFRFDRGVPTLMETHRRPLLHLLSQDVLEDKRDQLQMAVLTLIRGGARLREKDAMGLSAVEYAGIAPDPELGAMVVLSSMLDNDMTVNAPPAMERLFALIPDEDNRIIARCRHQDIHDIVRQTLLSEPGLGVSGRGARYWTRFAESDLGALGQADARWDSLLTRTQVNWRIKQAHLASDPENESEPFERWTSEARREFHDWQMNALTTAEESNRLQTWVGAALKKSWPHPEMRQQWREAITGSDPNLALKVLSDGAHLIHPDDRIGNLYPRPLIYLLDHMMVPPHSDEEVEEQSDRRRLARILMGHGASLHEPDSSGFIPADYAAVCADPEIGADVITRTILESLEVGRPLMDKPLERAFVKLDDLSNRDRAMTQFVAVHEGVRRRLLTELDAGSLDPKADPVLKFWLVEFPWQSPTHLPAPSESHRIAKAGLHTMPESDVEEARRKMKLRSWLHHFRTTELQKVMASESSIFNPGSSPS